MDDLLSFGVPILEVMRTSTNCSARHVPLLTKLSLSALFPTFVIVAASKTA